jgi:hypothetical protein
MLWNMLICYTSMSYMFNLVHIFTMIYVLDLDLIMFLFWKLPNSFNIAVDEEARNGRCLVLSRWVWQCHAFSCINWVLSSTTYSLVGRRQSLPVITYVSASTTFFFTLSLYLSLYMVFACFFPARRTTAGKSSRLHVT